jgi:hypothetical protein
MYVYVYRMKFGMDVIPLGSTLKSHFSVSTISNAKMADKRTCEVGPKLLTVGSYNDVWLYAFGKYETLV